MQARWLTLPHRGGLRTPELQNLVTAFQKDYRRIWDSVREPRQLMELAIVAGLGPDRILEASAKVCDDAWQNWTEGATDPRPLQVINALRQWADNRAGFEEVWGTWELAEVLQKEVREWHSQQRGAVWATAILQAVDACHRLATTARDIAEPEPGHDQHDPARYARKNQDATYHEYLYGFTEAVETAATAGSWWHSHSEPSASQADHDAYAQQVVGFLLRQTITVDEVAEGLQQRLG
jgi:hypothetical protein